MNFDHNDHIMDQTSWSVINYHHMPPCFAVFGWRPTPMDRWERLGRLGVGQKPLVEEARQTVFGHGCVGGIIHDGVIVRYPAWLCQNSYWKWWLIVDLPINSMVMFHSYVNVYQRVHPAFLGNLFVIWRFAVILWKLPKSNVESWIHLLVQRVFKFGWPERTTYSRDTFEFAGTVSVSIGSIQSPGNWVVSSIFDSYF